MTLVAPHLRALLNRTLRVIWHLAGLGLVAFVLAHYLLPYQRAGFFAHILGAAAVPVIGWLWLVVFNNGRLALPEAKVELDGDALRYVHLEEVVTIPWSEFKDYGLTWEWPRRVRITRSSGKSVLIDIFAFTRNQRDLILQELNGRSSAA